MNAEQVFARPEVAAVLRAGGEEGCIEVSRLDEASRGSGAAMPPAN
jgi:hypothetical protein